MAIELNEEEQILLEDARRWIADDPEKVTREELTRLIKVIENPENTSESKGRSSAALGDLKDRFSGTLQFGTAGLRGAIEAGPNRMNRSVVIKAAAGIGAFLNEALPGQTPKVVIGYDARHFSRAFALDSAAVLTAAGADVFVLPGALPTPVLAFALKHLDADAGIMVTASHNPPKDNGYKVYLGGRVVEGDGKGAQIVPPYDGQIARHIAAVHSVRETPRAHDGWTILGHDVLETYVNDVIALSEPGPRDLSIVLTPLHGVGGAVVDKVLAHAGFSELMSVEEQYEPDPDFPTVSFPNPEEPGAIDLALEYAVRGNADLVIANDPDADRCAVAVKDPRIAAANTEAPAKSPARAGWRMLHGDEVGALLGEYVAERADEGALANSIVSSRLLSRIAEAHGLGYASTLTGFKWISRAPNLVFGYEEALGYCVAPELVRDKDGISAALIVAQLAAQLKADGRSIIDYLDDLARQHGLHLTDQLSARFSDLSQIPATMARLRGAPPATLAGSAVTQVVDLSDGVDGLPPTDGLRLLTEDGTRVIVRPSGTEPKVKCYMEVLADVEPDASFDALTEVRVSARERMQQVRADMAGALGI
ncbi:phospho-sugar mutase [Timonella senegalensis]|uniref:phospho-sugar mutase n=1 Tax=Timonella senegalensis TaxID=1465825 RepID=UPI0002F4A450|nr:phospho-sugar mutase [Timonella senegalensis]